MIVEVINPKHVAYTSVRKYVLCITKRLELFPRFSYTKRDVFCQNSKTIFWYRRHMFALLDLDNLNGTKTVASGKALSFGIVF